MRLSPVLLIVITLVLLGGCRPNRGPTLTEKHSGQTIHLAQGDTFFVRLKANYTTPDSWFLVLPADSALSLEGEPTYVSESNAVGAGGEETWTFRALRPGTHTLRLEKKVRRDEAAFKQVVYTVEVQ